MKTPCVDENFPISKSYIMAWKKGKKPFFIHVHFSLLRSAFNVDAQNFSTAF